MISKIQVKKWESWKWARARPKSILKKDKLKDNMETELDVFWMTVFKYSSTMSKVKKLEKGKKIKSCGIWKYAYCIKLETVEAYFWIKL